MTPNEFPTYPFEQLDSITLNGISPESMNYPFDCKWIKDKRFAPNLVNDRQVFFASTQVKNPVFRFRLNQEIDVHNPYGFETRAICCGQLEFLYRGFRMRGFLCQFID